MGKFISFGKINKQYKYILIHVSLILASHFIFSDTFPEQIKPNFFDIKNYPRIILVHRFFNYLGAFIFSIGFLFYQRHQTKKVKDKTVELKNNLDILHNYELIYEKHEPVIKIKKIFFIIFLSISFYHIVNILITIGFLGLIFWVFDLFFMSYINLLVFDIPIYSHKKFAVIFKIIFSTTFKILSTFEYIYNDKYDLIYKNHIFLIPIIIISFFLITLVRYYSLFKIKWFLDYKFIPMELFFIIYNIVRIFFFSCSYIKFY